MCVFCFVFRLICLSLFLYIFQYAWGDLKFNLMLPLLILNFFLSIFLLLLILRILFCFSPVRFFLLSPFFSVLIISLCPHRFSFPPVPQSSFSSFPSTISSSLSPLSTLHSSSPQNPPTSPAFLPTTTTTTFISLLPPSSLRCSSCFPPHLSPSSSLTLSPHVIRSKPLQTPLFLRLWC